MLIEGGASVSEPHICLYSRNLSGHVSICMSVHQKKKDTGLSEYVCEVTHI